MSLKIIIVPFSIMFLVLAGIFWIYPEYGIVQEKTKTVEAKVLELQKSQGMVENGKALLENLQANKEKNDVLLNVFPRQGSEEDALWFLSRLAQNSGVSLTSVSVSKAQEAAASTSQNQTMGSAMKNVDVTSAAPSAPMTGTNAAGPMNVAGVAGPTGAMGMMNSPASGMMRTVSESLAAKYVSVTFDSVGTYESFQKFLASIKSIPRILREDTIKINAKKSEKEETTFQMSGTLSFAYAPLKRADSGVISPVFELSVFDFSPVDKVREGTQAYVASQEIPAGRPNPFVP